MANRKKKPASLGCLFWIAFILLVLVLFFFNRKNIGSVLEKTGLTELLFGGKHTVENTSPAVTPRQADEPPEVTLVPAEEKPSTPADKPPEKTPDKQEPATTKPPESTKPEPATKPVATTDNQSTPQQTTPTETKPAETVNTRKASLFFVVIDSDGHVLRKDVSRDIPQTASPLTETLKTLIAGPNTAEQAKGLRTLIPPGTRLLSVSVRDGVAWVNLSDDFQINQYGIEGYLGQLAQIVFTATAFNTVKSVQFLIEGQRREYLGGEGVWIGTPLSRDKW